MDNQQRCSFARSRLPWIIAAAAFVLYLITLNQWVSLAGLSVANLVVEPDATPPLNGPLHYLVARVARLLPAGAQMIALNVFSAVCAALTLALLARSVALLPHDRTREQRQRERSEFSLLSIPVAWAPPLFAALVCGLQLSFWEHATAYTGELLDLLLFAYTIRCLLEYRLDQRERWLMRLALAYGVAATNNYAMIACFPLFLAALIWIKGTAFFEFRFLARTAGIGAAGLTLYLLLPLISALTENTGFDFWTALRLQLANQKNSILGFDRFVLFCAALTSLLPLLWIVIRWPSTFGDTSVAGAVLTNVMFRVVHLVLLAACLWAAFDFKFSPRVILENRLSSDALDAGAAVPLLTLYYIGALCLGYFAGYFLLVCREETGKSWHRVSGGARLANRLVAAVVWMALLAVPAGLVYKNFTALRASNGALLREYAGWVAEGLPRHGVTTLSDTSQLLSLVKIRLNQSETGTAHLLVDTRLLPYPVYHRLLHKRFPRRWPALPETERPVNFIPPQYLMSIIAGLAQSNEVFYLHPSFGYFFEPLYLRPHRLVYQLEPYATNAITPPALSDGVIAENQKFWTDIAPACDRLSALRGQNVRDARVIGRWISRSLNHWGVELQQSGRLVEAGQLFEQAQRLNRENVAARMNLDFNRSLREGKVKSADFARAIEDMFERYRDWNSLLAANGPIDDPAFRYRLGQKLAEQSLFRQAALQFIRVQQLEPANLDNLFWLANVYLFGQVHDKVLETTAGIRASKASSPLAATNQVELARLEAQAYFGKGDFGAAERTLLTARSQFPQNLAVLDALAQMYFASNRMDEALSALDEQLKLDPANVRALFGKAVILVNQQNFPQARAALDVVLRKDPANVQALLTQSLICMKAHDYSEADQIIEKILQNDPDNIEALLNRGALRIETKAYRQALEPLNHILKSEPNHQVALMNRAIALLQSGQLAAARRDYETLLAALPFEHRVHYGLGEIAYQQKDTAAAIRHYEAYQQYAPADLKELQEYQDVAKRLKELKVSPR